MESADALEEEKKLLNEAKYRNYMSNIDKALRNFEYSSEWADLISALGKLNKAISSNTQYQVIPRRIKISKRLAQCMHPALPSGVHLKALETYDVIFSKTGPERLATELFIYSAGLFPLLGYAAMNVRPALLGVYEKYFVPLGDKLRPALSGFLSGVLPGYENGLDHFERTNSLLTQVCVAVNPKYFYTVLWECVATNASIRLPAISYLLDHFNKRLGMQQQVYIMGHNRDVMMSGLCACLNDSLILVQRNTLEFLLLGFPMHTHYLSEADLVKLVTNGLNTILRRDMSLNRRLYSWLLGNEVAKSAIKLEQALDESDDTTESNFDKHSKHILIQSIICTLKFSLESTPVDLKPYRIMVSLLDKAEIGSAVLDYVLCDIIRTMSLSSGNVEVVKSANLLFATFDPAYIWSFMTIIYEKSCKKRNESSHLTRNLRHASSASRGEKFQCQVGSGEPSLVEICFLTEFLLETISLEMYNETTRIYLPKVFLAITQMLTIHSEYLSNDDIIASLKLCMKIVSRVQPMITSPIKLHTKLQVTVQDDHSIGGDSIHSAANAVSGSSTALPGSTLEKSKSDSKLNQSAAAFDVDPSKDSLSSTDEPIRRSNSNQNIDRRHNSSPKKTKKAKSFSKLSELDKEICPDTGQLITPQSSSDQDTPLSIKKLKNKKISPQLRLKIRKNRPQDLPVSSSDRDSSDSILLSALENDKEKEKKQQPPPQPPQKKEPQFVCDNVTQECNADEFSILEKCIRQYEVFFEVYLARKVLQINVQRTACTVTVKVETDPDSNAPPNVENIFKNEEVYEDVSVERMLEIDRYFETLQVNMMCRSKQLHQLLNRSLVSTTMDSASDVSDVEFKDCLSSGEHLDKLQMFDEKTERNINKLMEMRLSESLRNAIRLASNLLVEMSTFPNCNKNLVLDKTENELPSWLKVLTLVASYTQSDKELQLAAITTLFDLISLLKSQTEHTTSPGVTFVVMLPLLKFGHVSYIENKTRIFQLITSVLWNYLGEATIDPMQITSLLYQLHNCLESGIVETVIGNRMSSHYDAQLLKLRAGDMKALSNYKTDRASEIKMMCVSPVQPIEHTDHLKESESQSFKKFELLWHLGRDKQPSKGFEKTLLRVLDTLGLPYYMPIRTFVSKWLQESLLRGDLSRLLKPLHKILLSSNTRRIGIVHFHLMKKDGEETLAADAKEAEDKCDSVADRGVFAISSEDGNVRYHIDSSLTKKRSPIRSFQKKIFGVTLGSKNKTSIFVSDKTTNSITESDSNIGLTINPLENELDSVGSEEIPSLSSSAPNKMESSRKSSGNSEEKEEKIADVEDEDEEGPAMFDSSSTDDSECSTFETESENRESVEKDLSLGGSLGNIKRFVGDCERVSEKLTEHDRTKNRKTYKLTRAGSEVMEKLENAMSSVVVDGHAVEGNDSVHVADEYFGSSADVVETFVGELMDAVSKSCGDQPRSISSPRKKLKRVDAMRDQKSIRKSVSTGSAASKDKKRMSCISKTSTDSNNSLLGGRSSNEEKGTVTDSEGGSDEDVFVEEDPSSRSEKQSTASSATINVEDKRRSLSLETGGTSGHKIEWDLAKETLEKSKQNLEILRQNAALEAGKKHGHKKKNSKDFKRNFDKIHPFHTHMLLYFGVYDTKQTLYAFQTLRNIIACDTRTFLCLSITTSFSSGSMKQLLIRHRKTILGKGFAGSITNNEFSQSYRGCMHLEVLVTICLYFARGFFHKESTEGNDIPRKDDIIGNYKVQLQSVELLTLICSELIDIVKGMGKGLACYIADLMARCKLQKIILHCINSSVVSFNQIRDHTLSEEILNFNNVGDEHLHAESFQIQLLRLLMAVIKLEYEVTLLQNETGSVEVGKGGDTTSSNSPTRLSADGPVTNVKYLPNCLISQQHMFLSAVLSALQADHLRHVHRNWTDLVTSSLNCFTFGSLTNIVISVVHQLCNNLDKIAKFSLKQQCNFPPDYVVSQLEAITILCHYCLLDNTQQTTLSHLFNQAYPQTSSAVQSSNTGQLLNNIVHSFLSSQNSAEAQSRNAQHMAARNAVLSHLSRIVTSVAAIWDSELGQVRQVKQQLMEFLSPVSLHHGANFLAAVAVTWQERGEAYRKRMAAERNEIKLTIAEQFLRNSTPQACPEQLSLVKLVSSIRVMPMDSFVQTLHQVVKSPPPIHRPPAGLTIEVSALELFYFYMKSAPAPQLGESWSSLLVLLRDGLNLSPPAQFTLLMLLSEFVQRCPQMPFQDKKDIRDVHDITSRLIEALTTVAGACLEPTTWLRRNLAVKEDTSPVTPDGTIKDLTGTQQYCIQAHSVLAATLANLLDVAYGSQEKDKVVTIVTNLMYTIMPYLKNHTARNIPSFYASSSLLASLSGYQYTRKAWRKDMLDLLLDNSFFQMDISCLPFWKQIMDSLMTYDSTTFRELMSRVSPAQSGSLYIFASREQEYEQRAMFLKRLAFVIFCSELDQYHKYMPEIQEQLANSLRLLPVIPAVQSAVFLCFRVLLLRMSPDHVTSLWPTIIAEMVQVFLAIEQELKSTTEDLRHNASNNNSNTSNSQQMSWTSNSSNGIASQNHLYHWRAVQLETAKLLELGCVLPATNLPHFQMYRWAFVGTEFNTPDRSLSNGDYDDMLPNSSQYVPHIRRISRLMDQKYSVHSPKADCKRGTHLVLTCQQIVSLQDLYGFFSTLSVTCPTPRNFADTGKEVSSCLAEIEEVLAKDFLEKMPTSTTPR